MTLNQVTKTIKDYAEAHNQIHHYHFGDVWEFVSHVETIKHASICCELTGGLVSNGQALLNFSLYFMDWVSADESNETEVLSDMLLVAGDMFALLNGGENDWSVSQNNPINFFTESTPDILAGCKMDISIVIDFELDRCAVPD